MSGLKTVPVDPTGKQLQAARDWLIKKYGIGVGIDDAIGCYKAMLEAVKPDELRDKTGDLVMIVKAEWVLEHTQPSDRDGACAQCLPGDRFTDHGFVCYRHEAIALIGED